MKVFISWAGERSKVLAEFLRVWIKDVLQLAEPWVSSADINAGARWSPTIAEQLRNTKFGVICVTKTNSANPWLLFECGALAKTLDEDTFVCPYLIDINPRELPPGPLTQFQAKSTSKEDTEALMRTMNAALRDRALSNEAFGRAFERCWPDLENVLKSLPEEALPETPKPSDSDVLQEILVRVRSIDVARDRLETTVIGGRRWRNISPRASIPSLEDFVTKPEFAELRIATEALARQQLAQESEEPSAPEDEPKSKD